MQKSRKLNRILVIPAGLLSVYLASLYVHSGIKGFHYSVTMEKIISAKNYVRKLMRDGAWIRDMKAEDHLNGPRVSMSDPEVIQKIRYRFLIPPPAPLGHRYRLKEPTILDPSMGQSDRIKSILNRKRNGFFVEVGGLDGETRSNTLYFERFLNWTGLLIEPDPLNFARMKEVNRKAWLSQSCIGTKRFPEIVRFEQNENMGKILGTGVKNDHQRKNSGVIDVQCFPLYSYLLALNVTTVDYFSLDVEGVELDVLKTIPFHLVDIKTLSVEFLHVPGGKAALVKYMNDQGYVVRGTVTNRYWLAHDFIFEKVRRPKVFPKRLILLHADAVH